MSSHFQMVVRTTLVSLLAFPLAFAAGQAVTRPPISVTVDPPEATVHIGQTQGFRALVKGAEGDRIRWGVEEKGGGQITGSGVYTAPRIVGIYHVVAISKANPSSRSVAKVTVVTEYDDPRQ